VAERRPVGVLDTSVYVDLAHLDPAALPEISQLSIITLAELHQGVPMAKDAATRHVRIGRLGIAIGNFEPLPFDRRTAARYGSLVGLTVAANRDPRSRTMDLMIAAVASCHDLPLYTRNAKDFVGLESLVEVIEV
jgi:predicted nucleic acid-binding protein